MAPVLCLGMSCLARLWHILSVPSHVPSATLSSVLSVCSQAVFRCRRWRMSSGGRQAGEAAAEEGANFPLSFNALSLCLCGGRCPCQERGPAFLSLWLCLTVTSVLLRLLWAPVLSVQQQTNVMWTLQPRCQDSCQRFGFLVPTPRLGRILRLGRPQPQLVWMGAFGLGWGPWQSLALVGENKAGFAVGVS